ncbi:hypothetical protein HYS03_02515 [Candidatus Woesebacteria bacterium]|nr:hypothetical protein [Candidatus Woesebacteria bacterium]
MKNAIVEWGMPDTISGFRRKIYNYAKWDAKSGIWWNPVQKFSSHNIKATFIIIRYLIGVVLLFLSFSEPLIRMILSILVILYISWAYRKAGIWGPVLQISSDFAVMRGFIEGMLMSK